jgi:hypothetical protein
LNRRQHDLVTSNVSGSVSVLLGRGDGTFDGKTDHAVDSSWPWLAVADLNRDGKADLVTANNNGNSVSVLLNATP